MDIVNFTKRKHAFVLALLLHIVAIFCIGYYGIFSVKSQVVEKKSAKKFNSIPIEASMVSQDLVTTEMNKLRQQQQFKANQAKQQLVNLKQSANHLKLQNQLAKKDLTNLESQQQVALSKLSNLKQKLQQQTSQANHQLTKIYQKQTKLSLKLKQQQKLLKQQKLALQKTQKLLKLAKLRKQLKADQTVQFQQQLQNESAVLSQQHQVNQQRILAEVSKFESLVASKIKQAWRAQSQFYGKNLAAGLEVEFSPTGFIIKSKLYKASGSSALDLSIKHAMSKIKQLPVPHDPEIFELVKIVHIVFKPDEMLDKKA